MLYNQHDIVREVQRVGFLPFFAGEVEGFSIEEQISPDYWFPEGDAVEGVWEWKNDIMIDGDCAYGKFYQGKACFVSMEWFPHLVNVRRATYRPTADEELLLATVRANSSLLSRELKKMCGYTAPPRKRVQNPVERALAKEMPRPAPQRKGFDQAITRMQMGCVLTSAGFEYNYTRDGRRYGWSVARFCTPEDFFGEERLRVDCPPDTSRQLLMEHLAQALPQATPQQLQRLIQ